MSCGNEALNVTVQFKQKHGRLQKRPADLS